MKKFRIFFVLLAVVILASCVKMPANQYGPTSGGHGYTLIANNISNQSSITLNVNQNLVVSVKDSLGNTVLAQVQFGNGLILSGYQNSGQYTAAGTYYLIARVLNISKVVNLYLTVTVNGTNSAYTIKVGSSLSNDTARVVVNTPVTMEVDNANSQAVYADIYFGNGSSALSQLGVSYTYPTPGKYQISATVRSDNSTVTRYIVVQATASIYTLTINGVAITSGSTFTTTKGTLLNFKIVDNNGNAQVSDIDFGIGNKVFGITAIGFTYSTVGTYNLLATTNGQSIPIKIVVNDITTTSDMVQILSVSYANGQNSISLGLRCDAITGVNTGVPAQIQSEMVGNSLWTWSTLTLQTSDIVTISGVQYYKWNFTCINGNIRFGWLQGANWAWKTSIYKRPDGLYGLSINNGVINPYLQ